MTDFRERVFAARDESALKRLASRIPGYGGYLDKEMRRDADKLLREHIAARLDQHRRSLLEFQQELLGGGGLGLMDDADRVQRKLQLLIDRLRTAVYGYAGWFDAITIREDALNALYDYDATLLHDADRVDGAVKAFGKAVLDKGDIRGTLSSLRELLDELHRKVDGRRDVLLGTEPPVAGPSGVAEPGSLAESTPPVEPTPAVEPIPPAPGEVPPVVPTKVDPK